MPDHNGACEIEEDAKIKMMQNPDLCWEQYSCVRIKPIGGTGSWFDDLIGNRDPKEMIDRVTVKMLIEDCVNRPKGVVPDSVYRIFPGIEF